MWKQLGIVVSVSIVSLLIFWAPFLLRLHNIWGIDFGGHGTETIVANFDGLNYIAVAKTLYDSNLLARDFVSFGNPPIYYAAHFPLYPLLIRALDTFTTGPQALLLATIITNALLGAGLYFFFQTFLKNNKLATILSLVALFFPARMLSVRAVGSSEPLFMFFVLTSLALAYRGKHMWGAILGSLAILTRSLGIFLFGAYVLSALASYPTDWKKIITKISPYLLLPVTLFGIFLFYGQRYGNFWAYFDSSSELHPVFFIPLLIFSNTQRWITDMWREDILYLYLLYGTGIYLYLRKIWRKCGFEELSSLAYGVLYGLFLLLIAHRDLARYALPIAPIALLGFTPIFAHKHTKWLLLLILPIYLLGWQFVVANVQPVSDWGPIL